MEGFVGEFLFFVLGVSLVGARGMMTYGNALRINAEELVIEGRTLFR